MGMKRQKGFTLVELVVVVAIISMLATFVFKGLGGGMGAGKEAQLVEQVKQVMAGAHRWSTGNFTGVSMTVLDGTKAFTDQSIGTGTGITPWGGDITIAVNSSDPSKFNISVSAVPEAVGHIVGRKLPGATYTAGTKVLVVPGGSSS